MGARYTDEFLLAAAARVFHRSGFHAASMADIAIEAGATKPTLYARLGGKDAIYDRVMERIASSLLGALAPLYDQVGDLTAEEAAYLPVAEFFAWVRRKPHDFELLFVPTAAAPTGVDHRAKALASLTDMLADANARFLRGRGLSPGRATGLLAAQIVGVLDHGARHAVQHDLLDRVDLATFTATFILHGLEGASPEALRRRPEPQSPI
jgi:AcrR family transcriptional regulator